MKHLPNSFTEVDFEQHEYTAALAVSAYTYMYLQNKIAAYAKAVLEFSYDPTTDPRVAVIEHEVLKGKVIVLQELMRELTPPIEQDAKEPESQAHHS